MTALLELKGVHAAYGGALVLDGVDFKIDAGETVGLIGRNGAGKTTTLLSIFRVPTVRGEILVEGKPPGATSGGRSRFSSTSRLAKMPRSSGQKAMPMREI